MAFLNLLALPIWVKRKACMNTLGSLFICAYRSVQYYEACRKKVKQSLGISAADVPIIFVKFKMGLIGLIILKFL